MAVKLRERKLKDGAKSYYLDCSFNGERWTETIKGKHTKGGKHNKELKILAETTRANREIELSSKGLNYIPNHKKSIFISTYFEDYISNYAKKDIRMLKSSYNWFKKFLDEPNNKTSNKLFELTKTDCINFKSYLTSSHLTGETPHNLLSRFKKIIKQAVADGYLYDNPTDGVTIKRKNKLKKEILTADELRLLKDTYCGNNEIKRAFLFAAFTGLGLAECQKLQWKHIKNNKVKILRSKLADKDIWINNNLSNTALEILNQSTDKRKDTPIFNLQSKHKKGFLSNNGVNKAIKNWITRANIDKHITFYSARHSFAVLLLNNGANLKTVADCMGHESTAHTIKYLNFVENLQDEAINNLPTL